MAVLVIDLVPSEPFTDFTILFRPLRKQSRYNEDVNLEFYCVTFTFDKITAFSTKSFWTFCHSPKLLVIIIFIMFEAL